jgi:hypothetical protein
MADVQGRGRWAFSETRGLGGQFRVDHHTTSPAISGDRIQAATSIHPSTMPAVARARPRRNPRDRSIRALAREPNTSARTVARAEAVMAGTTKPNSPLPAGSATINAEHAATSDAADSSGPESPFPSVHSCSHSPTPMRASRSYASGRRCRAHRRQMARGCTSEPGGRRRYEHGVVTGSDEHVGLGRW